MRNPEEYQLQLPDWDILLERLIKLAHFDVSKEMMLESVPSEEIESRFDAIQFFQEYIIDGHLPSFDQLVSKIDGTLDLDSMAIQLAKQSFFGIKVQNSLVLVLQHTSQVMRQTPSHDLNPLHLVKEHLSASHLQKFIKEFRHLVSEDGEIDITRHPELQTRHTNLYNLEERIRRHIQELITSETFSSLLQFKSFDVIQDRYVLPIRTDSYKYDLGLIISRSDSGHTLFVEPFSVRDLAMKRMEILSQIRQIIYQIEWNFFKKLHSFSDTIRTTVEALKRFDIMQARARFCLSQRLCRPILLSSPGFHFSGIFHPLIHNPVRNDIVLKPEQLAIVISGPNTGGKSALLKAVALSYRLLEQGLFVPAQAAEMFPYSKVHFAANDLQDIEGGLSSFSGEVAAYLKLLEHLAPNNLIIVDEIFNSTSSEEASALAVALIEEANREHKVHFILSTHHQMLKLFAAEDVLFVSGSVGFDIEQMKPNYKFYQGTPGQSMALEIFHNLSDGTPYSAAIFQRARTLLDGRQVNYERLLSELTNKQIAIDKMADEIQDRERELISREKSMHGLLQLKLQDELHEAKLRMEEILAQARQVLDDTKSGLIQKNRRIDDRKAELNTRLEDIVSGDGGPKTPPPHDSRDGIAPQFLRPGDTYYNLLLKSDVVLKQIDWRKRQATVVRGSLTVTVPVESFSKSNKPVKSFADVKVSVTKNIERPFFLDCRGMRLEEFQHAVERGLSDLLTGDIPILSVIHGHGDGILKNWLRTYLTKSKDFGWQVPESGNDGETEIRLK